MCTLDEMKVFGESMNPYDGQNGLDELTEVKRRERATLPQNVVDEFINVFSEKPSLTWLLGEVKPSTKSAVSFTALAAYHHMDSEINRLFFAAKTKYPTPNNGDGIAPIPQHLGIIYLVYSLVSQVVDELLEYMKSVDGIDPERFKLLDGSFGSLQNALELFKDLLDHINGRVIWVLDSLDLLENDSTVEHLKHLYRIAQLRESTKGDMILFTTNGECSFLNTIYNAPRAQGIVPQERNMSMRYYIRRLPGQEIEIK
jgi:hypothetical protein